MRPVEPRAHMPGGVQCIVRFRYCRHAIASVTQTPEREMSLRHVIGAMLAVGALTGCGVTSEGPEEEAPNSSQVGALDACDGTTLWEYNFYSDSSHFEQIGGIICKCRGTVVTWGDTSTPYVSYWSGVCPGDPAS